jgi:hypothetical protein
VARLLRAGGVTPMTWGECDGREPPIMRITTLKYAELEILQGLQKRNHDKIWGQKRNKEYVDSDSLSKLHRHDLSLAGSNPQIRREYM